MGLQLKQTPVLPRTRAQFSGPVSGSWPPPVTPALGDLLPSSGFHWDLRCFAHTRRAPPPMHNLKNKNLK